MPLITSDEIVDYLVDRLQHCGFQIEQETVTCAELLEILKNTDFVPAKPSLPTEQQTDSEETRRAEILRESTPRPWTASRDSIMEQHGISIVNCWDRGSETPHPKANAALIVLAVNSYETDQQLIANLTDANEKIGKQLLEHSEEVNRRGELIKKLVEALDKIAYHGYHSGVIPCPTDYSFYIKPIQDIAKAALAIAEACTCGADRTGPSAEAHTNWCRAAKERQ